MDAACARVDELRQCVDIGVEQFALAAQVQDFSDDGVTALEFSKNLLGGAVLSCTTMS